MGEPGAPKHGPKPVSGRKRLSKTVRRGFYAVIQRVVPAPVRRPIGRALRGASEEREAQRRAVAEYAAAERRQAKAAAAKRKAQKQAERAAKARASAPRADAPPPAEDEPAPH